MAWRIEIERAAARELDKLDPPVARRILRFLHERLSPLDDPRSLGEALTGSQLGDFWKYRIGGYRVIVALRDEELVVLVLRVGRRDSVYRRPL
jgi:mRNA interferase RelE/StbE